MGMQVMLMVARSIRFSPQTSTASSQKLATIRPVLKPRMSIFKLVRTSVMRSITLNSTFHCLPFRLIVHSRSQGLSLLNFHPTAVPRLTKPLSWLHCNPTLHPALCFSPLLSLFVLLLFNPSNQLFHVFIVE